MNKDTYRRKAEEALRNANKADNPSDRKMWLSLAEGWLNLIGESPEAGEQPAPVASPRRPRRI